MDALWVIAKRYGLRLIEDCAQAHAARYKGRSVGAIGDVGCFSFYPGKNLGAFGDGGAIVTNCEALAAKCRMIANHGRKAKYHHKFEGRNSRLDGLQAAILSVKLRYLNKWTDARISIADEYINQLKDIPEIVLPVRQPWAFQVYHLFVIRHADRNKLQQKLTGSEVETGVHYPIALKQEATHMATGSEK